VAERRERSGFRRSVAARVLASYAIVTLAFALVAAWSVFTQRAAARETKLVRTGYFPLALSVRDLVAKQDTWNTQLNHITAAKNPADIGVWFDVSLRLGRPRTFTEIRSAITRAFVSDGDERSSRVGAALLSDVRSIELFLRGDAERIERLFQALDRGDAAQAERLRDELVTRGSQALRRLRRLEYEVVRNVDAMLEEAHAREVVAIRLLIGLALLTVLVGMLMALYARRVLRPLASVTERAQAVARGDLEPRKAVVSNDEIGELAATFERMVSAIGEANTRLVAAERLATIGKMAAHMTHEIRNPLSSIALNLELLEEQLPAGDPEAHGLLKAIGKEVERLSALSRQYLSFARQMPSELATEDVGEVVREAAEFVRRDLEKHDVALEIQVEPGLPAVHADEGQLKQALLNLLRNAREAMPSGGRVRVSVERGPEGGVDICVDDEGPGVDPELRDRLFEPFFSTKSHGTGLGLAITRQIAVSHGGSIACEPRDDRLGTRFRLRLPQQPVYSARPWQSS
jgi:signal transduction histidine kinase